MLNKICVGLVNYLLSKSNLTLAQRNSVVVHILDSLQGLPLASIITVNELGETLINGSPLDMEKAKQLKESARVALDNIALKVINQQVVFQAVTGGVHNAVTPEHLYFYRAAIWFSQQAEAQLKLLAQRSEEPNL